MSRPARPARSLTCAPAALFAQFSLAILATVLGGRPLAAAEPAQRLAHRHLVNHLERPRLPRGRHDKHPSRKGPHRTDLRQAHLAL